MLSQCGLFKHGITYLAPRQRITTFLASMIDQAAEIEKSEGRFRFESSVSYEDMFGRKYKASYPIDFLQFLGLTRIGTPALRSIAEDVHRLRESIGHLESGWKRLKIDTYSTADRAAENARLDVMIAQRGESGETAHGDGDD
jgi:hypothetical protein